MIIYFQHLNLSKNLLGDVGGSYLLYLVESYAIRLEYLNISYNKIGKQTCEYLTNILHKNTLKLTSLNIGGNNIGDKIFSEICVGISKNSYLTKLFTNENELGKISATILGTILRYDKKIKLLDVSKNYLDDNIISYLLKGLISNVSLEVLYVNESNLTNRALRNFQTTLSINTSLREIFVEKNKFTNKCYETIAEIFNKNSHVEYISLAGNNLKTEIMDQVIDLQKKWPAKIISKTDYYQTKLNIEDKVNFYEFI
jgi:Ran GTPase-activating protein (RanGAP) involved in mRNA processing and transport